MNLYNRKALSPFSRATAEGINAETQKIESAIDALDTKIDALEVGTIAPRYTWLAWADSEDGTSNFSNAAAGDRAYIGIAYDKTTPTRSSFPEDYQWTRVRGLDGNSGTDGIDGADGLWVEYVWKRAAEQPDTPTGNSIPSGWGDEPPLGNSPLWMSRGKQELDGTLVGQWSTPVRMDGEDGEQGANGYSQAVINIYIRAAAAPPMPTNPVVYTFATAGVTGLNNGWATTIPNGSDPIWISSATAVSQGATDTIAAGQWASAVQLAEDGQAGINQATVFLFQRTATNEAPSKPSAAITYTFANGVAAGMNNGWSQSLPATGGPYRWITTATALSMNATDTIAGGEWATPAILSEDGTDGIDGADGVHGANVMQVFAYRRSATTPALPTATATYNFANRALTGLNNGWSATIPAGSDPIYATAATASSTGESDTIAASEWSTPIILAANGVNGTSGTDGVDGADGINAAVVFLFRRTATAVAPTKPSSNCIFNFSTGVLTGQNNDWSQTLPNTGGPFRWTITASALAAVNTDTIAPAEWSSATLLAEDGVKGNPGDKGDPGDKGNTGDRGSDAIAYVQDATPGAPPSPNMLWVKPSTREMFRWNGFWWERINGDLSRYDIISDSALIGSGVILSANIGHLQVKNANIETLTIGTDKVAANAITRIGFAQRASWITCPGSTTTEVLSRTVTKMETGSILDIHANIRIQSTNDIIGTVQLLRDGWLIDSAPIRVTGATGNDDAIIPFSFLDQDAGTGVRTYAIRFARFNNDGGTHNCTSGTNIRIIEFMK